MHVIPFSSTNFLEAYSSIFENIGYTRNSVDNEYYIPARLADSAE